MTDLPYECEAVLNKLDAVRRGELTHDEISTMQAHMEVCQRCLSIERYERAFLARLKAMGSPPCPEALRTRVSAALARSAHEA